MTLAEIIGSGAGIPASKVRRFFELGTQVPELKDDAEKALAMLDENLTMTALANLATTAADQLRKLVQGDVDPRFSPSHLI